MTVRLRNPVPLEAAIQLRRHLLGIKVEAGFNNSIAKAEVNILPANLENSGVSSNRNLVVNTSWDLDTCLDQNVTTRTNGLTLYHSTCFLNCYLFSNTNDEGGQQRARALFHSDLVRYFWPAPGVPNAAGVISPWTLPNENGQKVVREFYIARLNYDADFQKKPIIKLDIELTIYWAALAHDLYYPA